MSTSNEKSSKRINAGVLVIGGLFLAAGLSPYISQFYPSDTIEQEMDAVDKVPIESILLSESEPMSEEKKIVAIANVETKEENIENDEQLADGTVLPPLHESDTFFLNELSANSQQSLFVPVDIIRNMVVFVDNFSRGELVINFSPLQRPQENFSVTTQKDTLFINSDSYLRYEGYALAIDSLNTEKFIELYTMIMPLIDEAYQEIGYPSGSFNQTLDKAIDHLLETPIIHYKLKLISPSVMYQYADEHIEALPNTQKLMLRMGPHNLQMVQEKLKEIQNEIQRL